jgi:hypothetical protein
MFHIFIKRFFRKKVQILGRIIDLYFFHTFYFVISKIGRIIAEIKILYGKERYN